MKLYYTPGACSLAGRIALHEAGLPADFERVDLRARTTETGADFLIVNPKGYVPALVLDDGTLLTENIAVLFWIAAQAPALAPEGGFAPFRLLEALAFVSTEIHKSFKPFYRPDSTEAEKANAAAMIAKRLAYVAERLAEPFLLGGRFTVADAYLFVMLLWARKFGVQTPERLADYFERIGARDAVRRALSEEGLG